MRANEIIESIINHEFDFLSLMKKFDDGFEMPEDGYSQIRNIYFDQVDKRSNPISKERCIARLTNKLNELLGNLPEISSSHQPQSVEKIQILIEDLIGDLFIKNSYNNSPERKKIHLKVKLSAFLIAMNLLKDAGIIDCHKMRLYQLAEDNFIQETGKPISADSVKSLNNQLISTDQYSIVKGKLQSKIEEFPC